MADSGKSSRSTAAWYFALVRFSFASIAISALRVPWLVTAVNFSMKKALHVRAHVGRLTQLPQLLGQVADMTSMIRPEPPQLIRDEVVVAGADRLVVGHDGVHVEVDEVLHRVDR